MKVLLRHDNVLASILHQNNPENDDQIRTYKTGKVFHRNELIIWL